MRRLRTALIGALLLASACVHISEEPSPPLIPLCVTSCGLITLDGDCAALEAFQQRVLRSFARYVDNWTEAVACDGMAGWTIIIHERNMTDIACSPPGWLLVPRLCATGFTDIVNDKIVLTDTDWVNSALAHELVHAIDVRTYGTVGHCRWNDRGVKAGILEATGRADHSLPEASCFTPAE